MTRWSKAFGDGDGSNGVPTVDVAKIDAAWARIRERRARPRALRRVAIAAPVLALAAVLVLVLRTFFAASAGAGPVALAPIALVAGTPLPAEWTTLEPLAVALDDGSRLELAPATHVTTHRSAPDRVELAMDRGRTTFDVKPGGPRAWIIDAGSVRVEVLGTRFTVARDREPREHVEVSVERGKVKVTDPNGTRILTAGQSFASNEATPEPARSLTPSLTPAPPPPPPPPPPRSPTPAHTAASTPHLSEASPAGDREAPKADPMAEADALRKEGRSGEAVTILRGLVDSGDRRASLAAFTLGKIHAEELHDPALAGRWFERAIALGLPGGLDEEAQARAVECFAKAGAKDETARAAARYEARFPTGRHLARVREWNGASSR
jgi:transmembrane sensor